MKTITRELIRQGQSLAGGWNRKQVECLGLKWPPRRGWQRVMEGTPITDEAAARFLALRGETIRASKRQQNHQWKSDLPLPPQIKPKIAAALQHQWAYLKRMDPTDLKNCLVALQYMARASAQRVEGIEATPAAAAFSDEMDGDNEAAPW